MLHYRNDPCRHEPGCPDWLARSSYFCDFDDATPARNFKTAAGTPGDEFVDAHSATGVDDDLDLITFHGRPLAAKISSPFLR